MELLRLLLRVLPFVLASSYVPWKTAAQFESDKTGSLALASSLEEQHLLSDVNGYHGLAANDVATEDVELDPLRHLREALDVMQDTWFEVWLGTWPVRANGDIVFSASILHEERISCIYADPLASSSRGQ